MGGKMYLGEQMVTPVIISTECAFADITGDPMDNTALAEDLNAKQDVIDDLETIRSGASAGATALQPAALNGYATEQWVGNQGYLTGITSLMVTTALGYTPYNSSNPNGYQANVLEGVQVNGTDLTPDSNNKVDITVPTDTSDLTNGAGYTTNVGTVTSVNNVSPVNGNVTLSIPTVDQSFDGTSANAQSGVAVKSAIDSAISSVYKPAGSVAFASLPTLSSSIEGYVYNVTDAFTTTSDFVKGSGKSYPAGTNVVCIDISSTYKWDVLSGIVDLSGYVPTSRTVNSKALTSNISLDASDVGAVASNTAITGATKCKITYDSKGLVTAGADLSSSDITTALGFTPYDSSNPSGYTSNTGTVTSVNNTSPVNGNVTLSIPTVNDATLTIQQNGTAVATFTANSSSNQTANITVPTDTGDLTNGAGYITSSAISNMQTTTNLVTSVSSSSTDSQYPSAKLFYDTCGNITALINAL